MQYKARGTRRTGRIFSLVYVAIFLKVEITCRDNDIEMDKVDKIYNDVWTTPSLRTNGAPALATAPKPAPKPATAISTNPGARPPSTGKVFFKSD
jgi:hypothetical protein